MTWLAERLESTPGQAYTLLISVLLLVVTTGIGIPAVLNHDAAPSAAMGFTPASQRPPGSALGAGGPDAPATQSELVPPEPDLPAGLGALAPLLQSANPPPEPPPATLIPQPMATTTTAPRGPLTVISAGWAASAGGTAAGAAGVPDRSLPVGVTAGAEDHRSLLRLTGGARALRLSVVDGPAANTGAGAAVMACPITISGWVAADNLTLDEAPEHDCANGAIGAVGDDGVWVFDLSRLDPDRPDGFALVAVTSPGATFRITFSRDTAP